jgi:hypothetical protein
MQNGPARRRLGVGKTCLSTTVERRGTLWKAAKRAGVSPDTALRARRRDEEFARRVEDARQLFADQLEEDLAAEPGVVGKIVMLKNIAPPSSSRRTSACM